MTTKSLYEVYSPALNITMLLRVGADAELRYTSNGSPVLGFRAVASQAYQQDNVWKSNDAWYKVSLFGDAALRMHDQGKEPRSGDIVIVECSSAKISAQGYINKDGAQSASLNIIASSVKAIARKTGATITPVNEPAVVGESVDADQIPF